MKKEAWLTYNKNLNRLARRRRAALGSRKVNMGLTYSEGSCTNQVIYCDACKGPVVNDQVGRRRHAMKNAACKAAMEGRLVPAVVRQAEKSGKEWMPE